MSNNKSKAKRPESLDGTDLYAAEKIMDKKEEDNGKTKYLIKWVGWGHRYNTWEPEENIASDSLVQEFEDRRQSGQLYKGVKRGTGHTTSTSTKLLKTSGESRAKKSKKSRKSSGLHSTNDSKVKSCDTLKTTEENEISQRLKSRSNSRSVDNSRRSSLSSHRNSLTIGEEMRGKPDPSQVSVSSDFEQSIHSIINKMIDNKSNYESNSSASDSEPELSFSKNSDKNRLINNSVINSENSENQLNLEPKVVLERLPKLVFKRLISNSYKTSYEISIKDSDNCQTTSTETNDNILNELVVESEKADKNDLNNNFNEKVIISDIDLVNSDQTKDKSEESVSSGEIHSPEDSSLANVPQKVTQNSPKPVEALNEHKSESIPIQNNKEETPLQSGSEPTIQTSADYIPIEKATNNGKVNDSVEKSRKDVEVLDTSSEVVESALSPEKPIEALTPEKTIEESNTEETTNREEAQKGADIPEAIANNDDSIDKNLTIIQSPETTSNEVANSASNSENANNKSKTEITNKQEFNNELIANKINCNKEKEVLTLDLTFNDDIMLDTITVNERAVANKTPEKDKDSDGVSDHQIVAQYSPVSDTEMDWSSIELETQNSQNSKSIKSLEKDNNLVECLPKDLDSVPNPKDTIGDKSSKTLVGTGDEFNDSQSQDSQSSESTPQPTGAKWTPQSDYIDKRVVNNIDFHSQLEVDLSPLPDPPSVTLAQSIPSVTYSPTTQTPIAQTFGKQVEQQLNIGLSQTQVNNATNNKSNDELQTTSAIICNSMNILSPSQDTNVETHSPTKQNQNKLMPSPTEALSHPTAVITLNTNQPPRPSAPLPLLPLQSTECSIADASNLPLLNQTGPINPMHQPFRPPIIRNHLSVQSMPYNSQYIGGHSAPALPQQSHSTHQNRFLENQMRMSSMMTRVVQHQTIPSPNITHTRTHSLGPEMTKSSFPQQPQNICRPPTTTAQHITSPPLPIRNNCGIRSSPMKSIRPQNTMIADINVVANRQSIPVHYPRHMSGVVGSAQPLGPNLRPTPRSGIMLSQPPYPTHVRVSVPTTQQSAPPQSLTNPFERPGIHFGGAHNRPEYMSPFHQRMQQNMSQQSSHERPQPYPYPGQRPQFVVPKTTPIPPMSVYSAHQSIASMQSSYMGQECPQNRITVQPKQSTEVRDKIQSMPRHSPTTPILEGRLNRMDYNAAALQRYNNEQTARANNDNMINKEQEVMQILDGRFRSADQRHESRPPIFGPHKCNQLNVPINNANINCNTNRTLANSSATEVQILHRLLSQSASNELFRTNESRCENVLNERNPNVLTESFQRESQSIPRSNSRSSLMSTPPTTPRSGHKDILTEAMEVIGSVEECVVCDDDIVQLDVCESDSNIEFIDSQVNTNNDLGEQTTADESECYFTIYADPNTDIANITNSDLVEMFKSNGLQVVDTDSHESQVIQSNADKESESEVENDLVIDLSQIDDKMLAEVTDQSSDLVFVVVDENNDLNETQETINVQIVGNTSDEDIPSDESAPQNAILNDSTLVGDQIDGQTVDKTPNDINCEVIDRQLEDNCKENVEVIVANDDLDLEMDVQCIVEEEVGVVTEPAEPTQYISMPTFLFDDQTDGKSRSTVTEAQNTENNESIEENMNSNEEQNEQIVDESIGICEEIINENNDESNENVITLNENEVNVGNNEEIVDKNEENVGIIEENIAENMKIEVKNNETNDKSDRSLETNTENIAENMKIEVKNNETNDKSDRSLETNTENIAENNENVVQNNINIESESTNKLNVETIKTSDLELPVAQSEVYCIEKQITLIKQNTTTIERVDTTTDSEEQHKSDESTEDKQTSDGMEENENKCEENDNKEVVETEVKETISLVKEDNSSDNILVIDVSNDKQLVETNKCHSLQTESVQHPFVSSSVEDFENSPSTLSSVRAQNQIPETVEEKISGVKQSTTPIVNLTTNPSDSDEQQMAPTTTTTGSIVKIIDNNCPNNTISANKSLTNLEVPLIHKQSVDKSNTSKKSVKSDKKRKTKLDLSSKPPKKTMSAEDEKKSLHLIRSRINGWDKGWTPKEIVGINSLNETLVFLVNWTNGEQTIVLSEVAKHKCPQLVIKFYEKHSVWDSDDE